MALSTTSASSTYNSLLPRADADDVATDRHAPAPREATTPHSERLSPPENALAPTPTPRTGEESLDPTERRILVVEENPATRRDLRFLLQARGYEVFETGGTTEALKLLEAVRPDLVLLGAAQSPSDDFENCRRLKATEALAEAPIIFLVEEADGWSATEGFLAGASDYIAKPIRVREALSRIEKHLGVRKLLQARGREIAELHSLHRTRDRVLRLASHDLRNSMNSIGDLAEMLSEDQFGKVSAEQKKVLSWITAAASGVTDLVEDLEAIASIESAGPPTKRTTQRLSEVAQTTVRLAHGTAAKKEQTLHLTVESEPAALSFDRNQVRRVIENLVSNAIKFSPPTSRIDLRLRQVADGIRLEVLDQGPGVPIEEQAHLFNEFSLTSVRPTAGERSTGLGLYIARQIITHHAGEIGMHNRPEGGACFHFTLPTQS